jgi:hypothetical protein
LVRLVTNTTNGCSATIPVPVTANTALPSLTLPATAPLTCVTLSVTLQNTSTPGVSYQWSGPGISGAAQTASAPQVSLPGTYQVTITDPVNGCTTTGSVAVLQDITDPVVSLAGGTLTCSAPTLNLTGTVLPATGITVQWLRDGTVIPGGSPTLAVQQGGTYTLLVTNTTNGCSAQAEAQVLVDQDDPDVTASGGEITCLVPTITLIGQSLTPGVSYLWTGPGGYSNTNALAPVTEPGSYLLTVTGTNGCTSQAGTIVTEDRDLPAAIASSSNVIDCTNPTTTLSATGSSSGSGFTYAWTGPGGSLVGSGNTVTNIAVTGVYTLTVTNTLTGCTATATTMVTDNQNLPSGLDVERRDPTCFGRRDGQLVINGVIGGTPPFLYSLNGGPFTPNNQFSGLGDGGYTISVQDAAGCLYTSPAFVLTEPLELTVDLDEDFILQWGRDTFLFALISPPNANIISIQWTPVGVDTTLNSREIQIKPFNQTLYGVVVTDAAGCRAEDKVLVLVEKRRPVYIPNAFAPAGEQNTRFYIQTGEGIEEIEIFEVFNRWGERVFRRENFQPNDPSLGWDGMFRDKPANPEVFVYYAKIRFNDGITILYKGDVTLMR